MKKKVHLVLGSGGARGIAHIGVIEALEENGYEIASVTGCSMGAVVGGIYAAGFQPIYKDWLLALTKASVFQLMDFTLSSQGFLKGERVFNVLQQFTGRPNIEDLKIPFTAVAADIAGEREVHYRTGDLYKALRASIAIPGIFTPVVENGHFLVDGGVLNPLPLNLVQRKEGELVVAVSLNAPPTNSILQEAEEIKILSKWLTPMLKYARNKEAKLQSGAAYSLKELLISSYRMTQDRLTSLMLQVHQPDVLIEIPRNLCSIFEFEKANMLVEFGRKACLEALASSNLAAIKNDLGESISEGTKEQIQP